MTGAWSRGDQRRLRGLWEGGAEADDIAALLGRSPEAVRAKARALKYRRPAWYLAEVRAAAAQLAHESRGAQ